MILELVEKYGLNVLAFHYMSGATSFYFSCKETQMLEVIHTKGCIKVEEDEFLVTVAKETVDVADRMGGNANTASSPSFSISIVPNSFGQANAGDHIPGADLPPQMVVHDSNRKLENKVMIADTDREDKDNDESVSIQVGTAELPQEGCTNPNSSGRRGIQYMGSLSKAHKQMFSYEVECCGPGNRGCGSVFQQKNLSKSYSNQRLKGFAEVILALRLKGGGDLLGDCDNTRMPVWSKCAPLALTNDDVKQVMMREFGKNKGVHLSKKDLVAFFREHGSHFPSWRALRAMHHADRDGDGFIDEYEMKELIDCLRKWGYTIN
ncbi:hypothetical protein Ancab_030127 [Ancistrocladus abbreviatus]